MKGIARQAVAHHLGERRGAAPKGMLEGLEHHDGAALAEHEAVAVLVPGATGLLGRVVALGQCPRRAETGQAGGRRPGLARARQEHVGVAGHDQPAGQADGVGGGGAGGDDGEVRAGPLGLDVARAAWGSERGETPE